MEDKKDPEFNLILFYSNTKLSTENADSKIMTLNIILLTPECDLL